jgi:hypothetical protein
MRFVIILAAGLGLSFNALAADDIMANYCGNTVIGKSALGESHALTRHPYPDFRV